MSSILTNASAMTALQTLSALNKKLATTQGRISTGLRVAEASDNAAYWSIATTMQSDNKALSAISDSLGLGAGKVDNAYTAINNIKDTVDKIKAKLVSAQGKSLEDQKLIAAEIKGLQAGIKLSVASADFAGGNLLQNAGAAASDLKIAATYNRTGTTVVLDTINVAAVDTQILDIAGTGGILGTILATTFFNPVAATPPATGGVNDAAITTALGTVETALSKLVTGAAALGAAKATIDLQKIFVDSQMKAIERGIGALIDADMNEESARLSALQVQQQLGVQSLSIASSNAQNILALFRS